MSSRTAWRALGLAVLATMPVGCDYALHVPFPTLTKVDTGHGFLTGPVAARGFIWQVEPANPAFGETATFSASGLDPANPCKVYLLADVSQASSRPGQGTPQDKGAPRFYLGSLVSGAATASMAFDLRPLMGNDQYGHPFKLVRGQMVSMSFEVDLGSSTGFETSGDSFRIR